MARSPEMHRAATSLQLVAKVEAFYESLTRDEQQVLDAALRLAAAGSVAGSPGERHLNYDDGLAYLQGPGGKPAMISAVTVSSSEPGPVLIGALTVIWHANVTVSGGC